MAAGPTTRTMAGVTLAPATSPVSCLPFLACMNPLGHTVASPAWLQCASRGSNSPGFMHCRRH